MLLGTGAALCVALTTAGASSGNGTARTASPAPQRPRRPRPRRRCPRAASTTTTSPAPTTSPSTTRARTTTSPPTTTTTTTTPPPVSTREPRLAATCRDRERPDAPTTDPTTDASTTEPATTELALPRLSAAFAALERGNVAGALTVVRDHAVVAREAFGTTVGGLPASTATPLVLASVSKLITAVTIARLAESGALDLDAPVPWTAMGLVHDPGWDGVTARELLTHTAGMPVARASWLTEPGPCTIPLAAAMARPPTATRGRWVYSNGNYCALGLLVEHLTGERRDVAAQRLVLGPRTDAHLTTEPPVPGDGPYPQGLGRLERLGGAGTWMASTDAVAAMLDALTTPDRGHARLPGDVQPISTAGATPAPWTGPRPAPGSSRTVGRRWSR